LIEVLDLVPDTKESASAPRAANPDTLLISPLAAGGLRQVVCALLAGNDPKPVVL